jgi:2,3-bisphosphoglycerate-dependent phosphoglycerate mutase
VVQPTHLLLLRHAESEWNARGLWQGWANPPLSEQGRRQAMQAGGRLVGESLSAVAASDLDRSRQTAALLAAPLDLSIAVRIESDLREYDVGAWSGLTHAEIEAGWPGALQAWREGALEATPGGERRDGFVRRITGALLRLGQAFSGQRVLVVTHGGVIDALERTLGGQPRSVPYLCGRWFEVSCGQLRVGASLSTLDEQSTIQGERKQPAR